MGYYIDFIFNPEEINGYETVVDRFRNEGAQVIIDDTIPAHIAERCVDLYYEDLSMPITVFKRESKTLKGNWAHVRLSWGTNPETFYRDLQCMLTLAKRCNARLYDGQADREIKEELLSSIHAEFKKGSKWATNLLGKCTDKPSSE